jgi:TPR repeat protein
MIFKAFTRTLGAAAVIACLAGAAQAGELEDTRAAAEQGNARAQTNLGDMYANGRGVPQDYILAHMWFNLAAAQGDGDATKGRDMVEKKMTRAQIAEAQRLTREWKPKPE